MVTTINSLVFLLLFLILNTIAASPTYPRSTGSSDVAINHDSHTKSFQQRNLNTITSIYKRNIYPKNLEFAQNGSASVPPGLFNANARGRVTPLGNFTGFKDSTEYFFALSPIPQPPDYIGFSKIQIVSFQSACPEVASSVVYITASVIDPGGPENGKFLATLKQIAFWEFDAAGAVLKYDAWIPDLRLFNALLAPSSIANITTAQTQAGTIQTLCSAVQQECTGSNAQYTSIENCIETLSAKPFGDWDEVWQDSVICRFLHVILARVDPEAHCPHVGPTGGGKCVNESYNEGYFATDEALFGKPAGQNFVCAPIS